MRREKLKRAKTSQALIDLRKRLDESQQSMAHRMGVAIQTIARWETVDPPEYIALAHLEWIASDEKHPHPDLAKIFRDALEEHRKTQARKLEDILEEIGRWHEIKAHIETLRLEAAAMKDEAMGDRIIATLRKLNEVLAAAQRWSWRNR